MLCQMCAITSASGPVRARIPQPPSPPGSFGPDLLFRVRFNPPTLFGPASRRPVFLGVGAWSRKVGTGFRTGSCKSNWWRRTGEENTSLEALLIGRRASAGFRPAAAESKMGSL